VTIATIIDVMLAASVTSATMDGYQRYVIITVMITVATVTISKPVNICSNYSSGIVSRL